MIPPNENTRPHMEGLATLLVLDEEIRKLSTVREFGFFSTNETHRLISYHTGYLWQLKDFVGTHVIAQSGTAEIDIHAPVNQWLMHKINQIRVSPLAKEIHQLECEGTEENTSDTVSSGWPIGLPHYLLWCPFLSKSNQPS